MTWTYEEIDGDWLGGSRIAVVPEEVVGAFDRCERDLGRDWINAAKRDAKGSAPTLGVVTVGQYLGSIEDIVDAQRLRGRSSVPARPTGMSLSGCRTRMQGPSNSSRPRPDNCRPTRL
jgi:hypothetical protein